MTGDSYQYDFEERHAPKAGMEEHNYDLDLVIQKLVLLAHLMKPAMLLRELVDNLSFSQDARITYKLGVGYANLTAGFANLVLGFIIDVCQEVSSNDQYDSKKHYFALDKLWSHSHAIPNMVSKETTTVLRRVWFAVTILSGELQNGELQTPGVGEAPFQKLGFRRTDQQIRAKAVQL